ncbi:hypothetical protein DM01DRAFT_1335672 [Hesseltinella vesiculosa]|uniref:DUF4149 domain-containing protein n=1 Tax=Hesseltinella vesiculosa TaxID=101127 RepID=A0A1X2GIK6_9FUNG|nr:hypothetical protein DM01DRAFT_1335672 [Hesseltinella vesiculosa]
MADQYCEKLDKFLLDPLSTLKVAVPGGAIAALLHTQFWSKKSTRCVAVGLFAVTVGRLALTVHMGILETQVIRALPVLSNDQKLQLADYRRSWFNKLDVMTGIVSLDLFYIFTHRSTTSVSQCLTACVAAPVAITALQVFCFYPNYQREVAQVREKSKTADDLFKDPSFVTRHRLFHGMDFVKVSCLAVAGLRLGCMLSK